MPKISITAPGTFTEQPLKTLTDSYRQVVAQRFTPCGPEELPRYVSAPPFYVSRKIDGELWFIENSSAGVRLIAPNGRIATGDLPFLAAAQALEPGTVLAGELYSTTNAARERVTDVSSALAGSGKNLAFAAFDVVTHAEHNWQDIPYPGRLEILTSLSALSTSDFSMVPVSEIESVSELTARYDEVVGKESAEGLIVRCSDGRAFKVKPTFTLDLVILGYTTRSNKDNKEEIRSLLIGLAEDENTFVPIGTVGNSSESFDRVELLKRLSSLTVESEYRRAASNGQLYVMTKPEVLIECTVMDAQSTDSSGKAIKQPRLTLEGNTWVAHHSQPAVSLLNAVVSRIRDDKADVVSGARWAQIESFLPEGFNSSTVDLPASTVLRREVWTKTTGDKTDVRKLVVWQTHKENVDPSFPAFVVHWTDYSSSRKAPLAR
jgi:ATP-dependent DNA ligase